MFIILLTYKKPLEMVEKFLDDHRVFLEDCYQNNFFIVSGRRNPRTGGVIISQLENGTDIEKIIKQDPFYINEIADYEIIDFIPTKCHLNFEKFVK